MSWNLKNMLPAVVTSLVACTSVVNAADDAQIRNLENRVSALEQKKGANGMINPPGRPFLSDAGGIFVTGDLLWWQAHVNGIPYAIKNEGSSVFVSDGKVKNLNFDWDFGFRVGLGVNLPHDGWDIYANWVRFYTDASSHASADADDTIFTTNTNAATSPTTSSVTYASDKWRLHLNIIDLEMGREFFVSKWVTLRPFIGARSAWINQRIKTELSGGNIAAGSTDLVRWRDKFWGMGLRTGLNTQWGIGSGFSLFGDAAISILFGHFRIHEKEKVTSSTSSTSRLNLKDSFYQAEPVTDLAAGLRYDVMFDEDNYHFGIQAGYEQHLFFSQNQFLTSCDDVYDGKFFANQGDLSLNGWTLSARFDF